MFNSTDSDLFGLMQAYNAVYPASSISLITEIKAPGPSGGPQILPVPGNERGISPQKAPGPSGGPQIRPVPGNERGISPQGGTPVPPTQSFPSKESTPKSPRPTGTPTSSGSTGVPSKAKVSPTTGNPPLSPPPLPPVGTGKSKMEIQAQELRAMQAASRQRQGLTQSFDPFDVVLGHLIDEGYADTEEAALKIMANMSEEWRQNIVERGFGLGFLDLRKPAAKPKAEPAPKPPTVSSSGGAGGEVTVDKQYPATLGGKKGVKSTDAQGTEYFMPYQPQGGLPKPNTLPDLNKAQYKNTYTNTYKDIPASQSTKNPQSHLSRTGVPRVRSATRTYGID